MTHERDITDFIKLNRMSKIKGIPIGAGFILTEENDYFKIQSVSKNFSMRVNNTLPLYVACKEAMSNLDFRPVLQDLITMCYYPAAVQFNQEQYKKYVDFLNSLTLKDENIQSADKEHDEVLEQVKKEWNMKAGFKESDFFEKPIYYRPHYGSFEESDKEKFIVKSLNDIDNFYKNEKELRFIVIPTDLKCEYYGQDSRHELWYDTFIVTGMINGERIPLGFASGMLK